ncbi:MAG: Archaeal/vacuolar-type H+-ATPase subunit E [Eubacterium sp.]|nr:Archaeal/vacuolar-type H+-ATPase subunit E [Eubacterium sp.]
MTGLEKIISQIEYESNDRCRIIIEEANKKAQGIIDSAEAEASGILKESEEQTAKKLDNMSQSAVSSAELAKSKILLKSKLEIIDDMLDKALNEIRALGDEEYFEIIKSLILSNAKEGEGVLRLSAKDCARLPKDFLSSINKALGDKKIVLGDEADINGGFLLIYGDIDINCSFDAIASSKRDELRDALNSLLFS